MHNAKGCRNWAWLVAIANVLLGDRRDSRDKESGLPARQAWSGRSLKNSYRALHKAARHLAMRQPAPWRGALHLDELHSLSQVTA